MTSGRSNAPNVDLVHMVCELIEIADSLCEASNIPAKVSDETLVVQSSHA